MKLALAMIVKGDDKEAEMLDRCLDDIGCFVDAFYITSTYRKGEEPNKKIEEVVKKNAEHFNLPYSVTTFEWINDFAAARNFNFSQVPKDYDYVMWCDADDIWQNADKIRPVIEKSPTVDAFMVWYYYELDSQNNPTVIHKKSMIFRNDGCVKWAGRLHEDAQETRALNVQFIEGVQRVHLTNEEHVMTAQIRNIEISKEESEINPSDPRVHFNLANSYFGANKYKEAEKVYETFLATSESEDEKYIAEQRLAAVYHRLGEKNKAINALTLAIGMFPEIPDAYFQLGCLYFEYNMLDAAEKYLLLGLVIKPPYHQMIVFNPRDYDYNPMMTLAKVYFNKSRPDQAIPLLEGCLKIYPNDTHIKTVLDEMKLQKERMERVIEAVQHIETLNGDKEKILYTIEKLPTDLQSHPAICRVRNEYFRKETSSGKDIAYYCGETSFDWNPELFKTKGFGGSEEAVVNLAKEWTKQGYTVTVFNSCGVEPMTADGVTYKPFWHYNPRDKYDHTILWRTPRLADHELNTTHLYVDLHDVIANGEFNEKRLKRIDKIFVKTKAHRELFPEVPDDKFAIIPNGMDFELFDQDVVRDPYLMINTSSPDRSLDVLPELFKEVKKKIPQARLKWAYGWENYVNSFKNNKEKMAWKEKIEAEMKDAGIEVAGRLSQKECAKLYLEGTVLAYPTEFYEIDCISVKKAQACGCMPVTTDFAALKESVKYGYSVRSMKSKDNWNKPYQFHFGIESDDMKKEWVRLAVLALRDMGAMTPEERDHLHADMQQWTQDFAWPLIAAKWTQILQ